MPSSSCSHWSAIASMLRLGGHVNPRGMFAFADFVTRRSSFAFFVCFFDFFVDFCAVTAGFFASAASALESRSMTTPDRSVATRMIGTRDIAAEVTRYAAAMDLEILEALALST